MKVQAAAGLFFASLHRKTRFKIHVHRCSFVVSSGSNLLQNKPRHPGNDGF